MPTTEIQSNLKVITSGTRPSVTDLPKGHLAFGKIASDNRYHVYGNPSNEIVEFKDSKPIPFVYYCGVSLPSRLYPPDADMVYLSTLISDFFSSSIDMSMNLIISGTIGSPIRLQITGDNIRGAVCNMDFTDCTTKTTDTTPLIAIASSTARLNISGLVMGKANNGMYGGGVVGGINCNFDNCVFIGGSTTNNTTSAVGGGSYNTFTNCEIRHNPFRSFGNDDMEGAIIGGDYNTFINCIISGDVNAIYGGTNNTFINCTIVSTGGRAVYQGSNHKFINCTITSNSQYIVHMMSNSTFTNCNMSTNYAASGTTYGIHGGSNNKFRNCKITSTGMGTTYAVYQVSNTTFTNCTMTANSTAITRTVYPSSDNTFKNCTIVNTGTSTSYGIHITGATSKNLVFDGCKIVSNSHYAVYIASPYPATSSIHLINCSIKGGHATYDAYQVGGSNHRLHVTGCRFSKAQTRLNGVIQTEATNTLNDYIYMPLHANQFGATIE